MRTLLQNNDYFTLNNIKLFLLLFADDAVLFSYTKEGLQSLLDSLHSYCNKWGLTVNTKTPVIMVCNNGRPSIDPEMVYNGMKLNTVTNFTYLGVTLSYNGKFYMSQKRLSEQAMKAIFALYSTFGQILLKVGEKLKLFD